MLITFFLRIKMDRFMMISLRKSGRFAKSEVHAIGAHERMGAVFERHDTAIVKSGWAAPNHHVTVGNRHTARLISSLRSPKQKAGWDPTRAGADRLAKLPLVFILV